MKKSEKPAAKQTLFSRGNLITLALAAMFCGLFVVMGMLITAGRGGLMPKSLYQPVQELVVQWFNWSFPATYNKVIDGETVAVATDALTPILLTSLYIFVWACCVIFTSRIAKIKGHRILGIRAILFDILWTVICLGLSLGLIYFCFPGCRTAVGVLLLIDFALSLILFVFVGAVVTAIWSLVANIVNIDKPFKLAKGDEAIVADENEENGEDDVTNSFDVKPTSINGASIAGGAGGTGEGTYNQAEKARELDAREKVFPGLSNVDVHYDGYSIDSIETDESSLEEFCIGFRNWLAKEQKLYFDIETIRIFVAGLATSHFSILEGLSGTGKSSLPRYFAEYIGAESIFVPVQATWRDKTSLLGYFNDFSRSYSETDFLVKLYEACYNPDKLFVFVLDEMNISRIEYYFADFLSILEYPEDEWKLRIMHLPPEFLPPAKLDDGVLSIPNNCYFVGTANKDDSTFSIADKVYDRAVTIAFSERNEPFTPKGNVEPIHLSASKLHELFAEAKKAADSRVKKNDLESFTAITSFVYDTFDVAFGNRILKQIEELVPVYVACGGKKEEALDFMLARKVLYKLEGRFEEYVKPALKETLSKIEKTYGKGTFAMSEALLNKFIRKL